MNRVRKVFIRMNLALLLCVVFAATRGWAQSQSPDDTETNQSPTPQTQTGQQQQGQAANQDSEQSPGQKSEQIADGDGARAGRWADAVRWRRRKIRRCRPRRSSAFSRRSRTFWMSSRTRLRRSREWTRRRSPIDRCLSALRESEQTRIMATKELVARGYSVNPEGRRSPTSTAAGSQDNDENRKADATGAEERRLPMRIPTILRCTSRRFPTAICLRSLTSTLSFQRRGQS